VLTCIGLHLDCVGARIEQPWACLGVLYQKNFVGDYVQRD
jgi:hypothetical protein